MDCAMEQWEKEYIDAVTKANQAKNKGKTVDCSYEEGYDSSRWIEITLPDGKKYYVPKEAVGNRSGKRKKQNQYQAYNEACWNEVEYNPSQHSFPKQQLPYRYYSEKISFFRTLLKTIRRLLSLMLVTVLLVGLTEDNPETQMIITQIYVVASLGVIIYAVYYILRCLFEKNLRL